MAGTGALTGPLTGGLTADKGKEDDRTLHVLFVGDSTTVRQAMTAFLSHDPKLTVAVAADPIIAMEKMKRARPDVIILDLQMPRMDGLTFLRMIVANERIPVVICSGLTANGSEASLRALEEGAVD